MFNKSARIYDHIYSFKNYEKESSTLIDLIKSKRPFAKTILDIACGTSEHHKYLSKHFSVDGIDINPDFIEISKSKNKTGNYWNKDMQDFDLNTTYDIITCLFSSIAYVKNTRNLAKTLDGFKKHLKEDGLLIIEPWFKPEEFTKGRIFMQTYDGDEMKICRMSKSDVKSVNLSVIEFYYLVMDSTGKVEHFTEAHELALWTHQEMINSLNNSGFKVEYDESGLTGRGLYYCTFN